MPGPPPKRSSRRSRAAQGGLRTLAAVPTAHAPDWPLSPDARLDATREMLRDLEAKLQQQLVDEADRRKRYRIKNRLEKAQLELAMLQIQIEQAKDAEQAIWLDLWRTPQAAIWIENPASVREVALYVRWMVRAEQGDTRASSEARQLSNALGINPAALLRLRAEIEAVDAMEDRGRRRRERSAKPEETGADPDPRGGLFAV